MKRVSPRDGVTLVELLVVLVILGVFTGVVGVAINRASGAVSVDQIPRPIHVARSEAVTHGTRATITVDTASKVFAITVLPDGRVIADSALAIDRMTGGPTQ